MVQVTLQAYGTLTSLPTPSATENIEPPTAAAAGLLPAALPEGVYHNPYPLPTPMHDIPESLVGLWQQGISMDLIIHVNQDEYFKNYDLPPTCQIRQLILGQPFEPRVERLMIPLTKVEPNVTLYAHIFLTRSESPIHPNHSRFNPEHIVYKRHILTKHYSPTSSTGSFFVSNQLLRRLTPGKITTTRWADHQSHPSPPPMLSYWQEKITVSLVNDAKQAIPKGTLQRATLKYISLETISTNEKMVKRALQDKYPLLSDDIGHRIGFYRPIIFPNDFWLLQQYAYPVDANKTHLPLTIQVEPIALWKFNTLAVFGDGSNPFGGMTLAEMEQVKRLFLEMNPTWLCILLLLCGLYMLFSLLGFQQDILFWRNKKDSQGISLFGMSLRLLGHTIILLSLLDGAHHGKSFSFLLAFTHSFSMLIQLWKLNKILPTSSSLLSSLSPVSTQWDPLSSQMLFNGANTTQRPKLDKTENEVDAKTCILLGCGLTCICYNLFFFFCGSTILYYLAEIVHVTDVLFLLPQVIMNYQRKTVNHISKSTLLYKFLNIAIDTLFTVVIGTPLTQSIVFLYKDILYFFIFYQYYHYTSSPRH